MLTEKSIANLFFFCLERVCAYRYTHLYVYTRQNYICWKRWCSVTIIVNWKTSFQRLAWRISPAGFSLPSNFSKRAQNCIYSVINAFGKEAMTASSMEWCNPQVKSCFSEESGLPGSCESRCGAPRGAARLSAAPCAARLLSHCSESATHQKKEEGINAIVQRKK